MSFTGFAFYIAVRCGFDKHLVNSQLVVYITVMHVKLMLPGVKSNSSQYPLGGNTYLVIYNSV